MPNFHSNSFGILIAFFLPGLFAFFSLSFYSATVLNIFQTFITTKSNVGLFLIVAAGAFTIGLLLTVFRWVFFEKFICKNDSIETENFGSMWRSETKLNAFLSAVDEHYRYHQFWGSIFFIVPVFGFGLYRSSLLNSTSWGGKLITIVIIFLFFLASFCAAKDSYIKYVERANKIME